MKTSANKAARMRLLDLSDYFGEPVEEGVYEFTLSNGDEITIPDIQEGFKYEIWEVEQDGWELVDINGDISMTKAEGTMLHEDVEYIFMNRSITPEPEPEPEPEKSVEKKETPPVVNPQTGDRKLLPLVIMAGSAIVLTICSIILQIWKRRGYETSR